MDDLLQKEVPMRDKIIFFDRYCKDLNGATNPMTMANFLSLLVILDIEDTDLADLFYSEALNKDMSFNQDKCNFMVQAVSSLLNYCFENDQVAGTYINQDSFSARVYIHLALKSIIEANEAQNGVFDLESAKESFNSWLDYVANNKDEIDRAQRITLYDEHRAVVKELTIKEAATKYNCNPTKYMNTIYRLSSVLANFKNSTLQ